MRVGARGRFSTYLGRVVVGNAWYGMLADMLAQQGAGMPIPVERCVVAEHHPPLEVAPRHRVGLQIRQPGIDVEVGTAVVLRVPETVLEARIIELAQVPAAVRPRSRCTG